MVAALFTEEVILWQVALAVGAVVLVVVVVLLDLLRRLVTDIDTHVGSLWKVATNLAANTATAHQLDETAVALRELRDEVQQHEPTLREG